MARWSVGGVVRLPFQVQDGHLEDRRPVVATASLLGCQQLCWMASDMLTGPAMASVYCLDMAQLPHGQRARRSAARAGRVAFLAAALFLLGLIAIFASDAKATPQSTTGFSQVASATSTLTQGDDQQVVCPICGRLICAIPDDALEASPSNSALPPAGPRPMLVIGSVRLSKARAPDPLFSASPASFEPRGPPFVD